MLTYLGYKAGASVQKVSQKQIEVNAPGTEIFETEWSRREYKMSPTIATIDLDVIFFWEKYPKSILFHVRGVK